MPVPNKGARCKLYHVRSITLIPVGAGSPIIFAKNGQSHKPAPAIVLWAIDQTLYYNIYYQGEFAKASIIFDTLLDKLVRPVSE